MGHGPARPFVSRRQFLQRSAVLGLATAAGPYLWQQPARAAETPVEQLHAQFGADAAREVTISWMTPAAVTTPFLQLGGQRVPATTRQYPGYPGYFHHVRLRDLLPATRYTYAVGHAGQARSSTYGWLTGPLAGAAFTFTAFGDQGVDNPDPNNVQDVDPTMLNGLTTSQPPFLASANRELAQSMNPAFHCIVGDTAYANGDQDIWDVWFRGISDMAPTAPWMPCLGNHEIETMGVGLGGFNVSEELGQESDSWGKLGYDAYRTRFDLPPNGDPEWEGCWYRFRYGSVEFISIDNNDVNVEVPANIGYSKGRQRAWVERTLKAAAADPKVDFIIILMHQAAFSSGLHGSDEGVRKTWFPLFSQYGVDLVLQGHDHHYERTHLMTGADVALAAEGVYRSDIGTMYVVAGNGGAAQRGEGLQGGGDYTAAIAAQQIGTLKVQVIPNTGKGTKRLVLGEYSALTGAPIEEGVVIERTLGARAVAPAAPAVPAVPREAQVQDLLPATGSPAGITAAALTAVTGAAAARVWLRSRDEAHEEPDLG